MFKFIGFLILIFIYNSLTIAMDNKPYHHLSDGTFRNPKGSPVRSDKVKWSYRQFNQEKKKLDMNVPDEHSVDKEIVLSNLKKYNKNQFFFDYLKKDIKNKRKMGHLTTLVE